MDVKPKEPTVPCRLVGEDGNIFAVLGRARRALQKAGRHEDGYAMCQRVKNARSYDEALVIIMEYCHDAD